MTTAIPLRRPASVTQRLVLRWSADLSGLSKSPRSEGQPLWPCNAVVPTAVLVDATPFIRRGVDRLPGAPWQPRRPCCRRWFAGVPAHEGILANTTTSNVTSRRCSRRLCPTICCIRDQRRIRLGNCASTMYVSKKPRRGGYGRGPRRLRQHHGRPTRASP